MGKKFLCDCGENYYYEDSDMGVGSMPCTCSRVCEMDFFHLVEYVGDKTMQMPFLKYDIYRDKNKWTVCIGNIRIGDTDNPEELLREWIKKQWRKDD